MDRVSHPFDHPGPYTEECSSCHVNSHCPEKTGEKHKIYRIVFVARDDFFKISTSTSEEETEVSF